MMDLTAFKAKNNYLSNAVKSNVSSFFQTMKHLLMFKENNRMSILHYNKSFIILLGILKEVLQNILF